MYKIKCKQCKEENMFNKYDIEWIEQDCIDDMKMLSGFITCCSCGGAIFVERSYRIGNSKKSVYKYYDEVKN